jgi:hypothetical protein
VANDGEMFLLKKKLACILHTLAFQPFWFAKKLEIIAI